MYKLIIFDLDGTAIPNKPEGMPSGHLVEVVKRLQQEGKKVCAATGDRGLIPSRLLTNSD